MKTVRTALLTALMALSFGAFAAPAMAEDAIWTVEGTPIQEPFDIELSGTFNSQVVPGAASCDIVAQATLEPGGTGEITEVDLSNCVYSPDYYGCKQGTTSVTLPWSITPKWLGGQWSPAKVVIEDMALRVKLAPPCNEDFNFIYALDGELWAIPESHSSIEELNMGGWFQGPKLGATWNAPDLAVTLPGGEYRQVGVAQAPEE